MKKITLWVDEDVGALSITAITLSSGNCNINQAAFDITNKDEISMPETKSGNE